MKLRDAFFQGEPEEERLEASNEYAHLQPIPIIDWQNIMQWQDGNTTSVSLPSESKTWLEITKEVTEQQRQRRYGSPLVNFLRIAVRWTMWLQGRKGVPFVITPIDVAWMMLDLKVSRETFMHQEDNGIDGMGYLACHNAIDRDMKARGYESGAEAFREMTLAEMVELMEEITLEHKE